MATSNHFATQLQSLREAAGLSQYELARRTGLTRQTLSRLEMGDREPGWETVQLLAKALGVPCTDFIDPKVKLPDGEANPPRGRPRKPEAEPSAQKGKGRKKSRE